MIIQKGETLISLMIGLLISMIAISGMLMVFQNTLRVTAPASAAATADAEQIASLMQASHLLQKAGFGIDAAAINTEVVALNSLLWNSHGHSLSSVTGGNAANTAIVWGADVGDGYQCEAIVPTDEGGLQWLTASCTDATQWNSVQNWTNMDLADGMAITVVVTAEACQPFGIGTTGATTVTLTTITSSGATLTNTTCLANFAN